MNISANSNIIGNGHIVKLNVTDKRHYTGDTAKKIDDDVSTSFKDMLSSAVGKVNNLQVQANGLTQKMIYEPESVDIHTVMIATQKAEIALSFTKSVRDEAIRAYRELINLR